MRELWVAGEGENGERHWSQLEQELGRRELDRQQAYAGELEDKLKKLLADFGLFRTKAQQMLATKDEEISKLKGRRNQSSPRESEP